MVIGPNIKSIQLWLLLSLIFLNSGCRLTYLFHAASGQYQLLNGSIPVEEALKTDLSPEQKKHLRLVAHVKDFGEETLGLKRTDNYEKVYLKSSQNPIYTLSAAPKDRLSLMTWWFPVVGKMPYLGFFDLEKAKEEKAKLAGKDLDVILGMADAYSTLGWFKDPVTLNLLDGSSVALVETILHEMTHTTIYMKGQGAFNEGLANLVGKVGAVNFFEETYGSNASITIEARKIIEDERRFSSFLADLLKDLNALYHSSLSYEEKLAEREKIFSEAMNAFARVKQGFQTDRFIYFGHTGLNNAYLLSIGLYHQHFNLFEAVYRRENRSIRKTLLYFQALGREEGDLLEMVRAK